MFGRDHLSVYVYRREHPYWEVDGVIHYPWAQIIFRRAPGSSAKYWVITLNDRTQMPHLWMKDGEKLTPVEDWRGPVGGQQGILYDAVREVLFSVGYV